MVENHRASGCERRNSKEAINVVVYKTYQEMQRSELLRKKHIKALRTMQKKSEF